MTQQVSFHIGARYFRSGENIFYDSNRRPSKEDFLLISGLKAKF